MIRRTRLTMVVPVLLTLASGSAGAQSWEASGLFGFTPAAALDRKAPELTELDLDGGLTFGVQGAWFFTPRLGAEVLWTQQSSAVAIGTPVGTAALFSATIRQLHGNVVYQFGGARLKPFVFGGAGAAFFSADDLETDSKTAFGFGAGVKYFAGQSVGVRGHFRYKPAWLDDDSEDFCDPFGFCQGWLQQVEFAAGVVIRF